MALSRDPVIKVLLWHPLSGRSASPRLNVAINPQVSVYTLELYTYYFGCVCDFLIATKVRGSNLK